MVRRTTFLRAVRIFAGWSSHPSKPQRHISQNILGAPATAYLPRSLVSPWRAGSCRAAGDGPYQAPTRVYKASIKQTVL